MIHDELRGLSLTQPWASLVALGHKRVETRSWRTAYRGLVAIHASKGFPLFARSFADELHGRAILDGLPARELLPLGAIVAVARIAAIVDTRFALSITDSVVRAIGPVERELGDYGVGRWAWYLDDVHPLPEPIPCKGALALWELPEKVQTRLLEEFSAP